MANLTLEEQLRRKDLTEKLSIKTLDVNEAEELKSLLEKEKTQASSSGDVLATIAIALLIGLVIAYLARDN